MVSNRIESLDFVKFVAILLVCIGHCYAKVPALESSLHSIIYSFHMPLFMLVCGYFSVRSLELSMVELFLKKGEAINYSYIVLHSCDSLLIWGRVRSHWLCMVS